jgi:hypothetical protein
MSLAKVSVFIPLVVDFVLLIRSKSLSLVECPPTQGFSEIIVSAQKTTRAEMASAS